MIVAAVLNAGSPVSQAIMLASVAPACRVVMASVETLWMTRRKREQGGDRRRTRDGRAPAGADGGSFDIAARFYVMNVIFHYNVAQILASGTLHRICFSSEQDQPP